MHKEGRDVARFVVAAIHRGLVIWEEQKWQRSSLTLKKDDNLNCLLQAWPWLVYPSFDIIVHSFSGTKKRKEWKVKQKL